MDFEGLKSKLMSVIPGIVDYFNQINSTAVLAALVGGWVVGWIWYGLAGKFWKSAAGEGVRGQFSPRRQIFGGLAQIIMTVMLGTFMEKLGAMSALGGIHTAFLLWLGFVMSTILVNYANLGNRLGLALVDGIHWLLVLVAMGAIIGGFSELGIGTSARTAAVPAGIESTASGTAGESEAATAGTPTPVANPVKTISSGSSSN